MNLFQLETNSVLILWYFFALYFCIAMVLHIIFALAARVYRQKSEKLMTNRLTQETKEHVKK